MFITAEQLTSLLFDYVQHNLVGIEFDISTETPMFA